MARASDFYRDESSISGRRQISQEELDKLAESVCRIQTVTETGGRDATGFLCQIQVKDRLRYGIVTNNHVIKNTDPNHLQHVKIIFKELRSGGDRAFYLNNENIGELHETYSEIDACFIELSVSFQNKLREWKREFLNTDVNLEEGDGILVIQYPGSENGEKPSYSYGQITDTDPLWDLPPVFELHTAPTEPGSSGSPILLMSRKVFGIHRGSQEDRNQLTKIHYLIERLNGKSVEEIDSTGTLKNILHYISCTI